MTPQAKPTRLARTIAAVRRQYGVLLVLSCLVNLLLLVTAVYMLQVYDRVLSSGSLDTLLWLTVVAVVAIAIYGVLEQARRMILSRSAGWLDGELNAPMLKRAMQARLAGEAGQAGIRDVSSLRNFYGGDAALAFLDAPWSPIFLAFIWLLHPVLGIVATIGAMVLLTLALVNDLLTRPQQAQLSGAAQSIHESAVRFVDAGETIDPLGMADRILDRWRATKAENTAAQQGLRDRTTTILSVSRSLRLGLQVGILGVGAYFVLAGQITPGAMIAASIVMGRALAPIERATGAWRAFVAARNARESLAEMFGDAERDDTDRVTLPRPEGRIDFEGVYHTPPATREPILRAISFSLEPGENCAVVGASGSGKSSLCRLMVGAWRPSVGHVRLDGADVFEWDAEALGPHIGYLPQRVELFPGTIAQNISRFGEVDSEAVIRAAKLAGVHEMILTLPEGYETQISAHSQRISLGQRQRIALARALFGDPALVVLDEPNANMDEAGDHALLKALEALKQSGVTVVIVTHRASVLKAADKVLALRDGQVATFGPRDQILKPVSATPQPATAGTPAKPVPIPFDPAAGAPKPAPARPRRTAKPAPAPVAGKSRKAAAAAGPAGEATEAGQPPLILGPAQRIHAAE